MIESAIEALFIVLDPSRLVLNIKEKVLTLE